MIPLINLKKQYEMIEAELMDEMRKVLRSGQYILGPNVNQLEETVAQKLEVASAIAVANGTDALILTLDAFDIGEGDEVITTPFTFFSTAEAISRVGAKPVFADIDSQTYTICPNKIKEKITSSTKAIIPVHLFGQCAEMDAINRIAREHGLLVIEDACQAFGSTYKGKPAGSLGDVGCFSFFPTKNLGTLGDGGIITTSDSKLSQKLKTLRVHGSIKKYHHQHIGYNSRLDELHAAILLVGLRHIDQWNKQRIALGERYHYKLQGIKHMKLPKTAKDCLHVYHLFCIKSPFRKQIIEFLQKKKIQTGIYYPCCLHLQGAYHNLGYKVGDFPIAEQLSKELFAIPLFPLLGMADQDEVITALRESEGMLQC
ncbi:DegT/DnrJ/EryC1/StrS family aminotransferase [Virgibacillus flavescens]|uniref:DegT/DnrJ/EryC1/StrS family aminotransferase n=1 Tax=Virgibacillus flavescens TaxID=1611422 RepID=UPI003D34F266